MDQSYDNAGYEPPNGTPVRLSDDDSMFKTHYKNFENKPKPPAGWNLFRANQQDRGSVSERKYNEALKMWYKVLKMITMVVVFFVTLAGAVVSKGATMFMVSQVAGKKKNIPFCNHSLSLEFANIQNPTVSNSDLEKVGWLWCIFFAFSAPEVFTFIHSLRSVFMKTHSAPSVLEFAIVFMFETLHVIGTGILFFLAFPGMDSIRVLMATNAVAIFPGLLKIFMKNEFPGVFKWIGLALTIASVIFQVSALAVWPLESRAANDIDHRWAFPLGLFLTSFGWWECFVEEKGHLRKLWDIKTKLTDGGARGFTYLWISLWKVVLFMGCMMLMAPIAKIVPYYTALFTNFIESFETTEFILEGDNTGGGFLAKFYEISFWESPGFILIIQILCTWIAYIFGKFACKCNIQQLCFALPLNLVTPVCIAAIVPLCHKRAQNPCTYQVFPEHLFYECPPDSDSEQWFVDDFAWMWILWVLSQFWITFHIWMPKSRRLAATDQIFGTDYYNALLLDQSMMLNRRSDAGVKSRKFDFKTKHFSELRKSAEEEEEQTHKKKRRKISAWSDKNQDFNEISRKDDTVRIRGCATMWHESAEEIEEMLKSIFRIDEDYSARKLALNILNVDEQYLDYYEWESHIFFDDCMERSDVEKDELIVNQFVRLLINSVDEFGKKWYGKRHLHIPPAVKIATPYGGRLVWTLPGETQIICHLKDKNKIRHKKRWSQIMYMYYFLGHQLMDNPDLTDAQKEVRAENTFLLALDGDVDFQPEAIIKVVDLMKRNPSVGAACGRIHPTGSGYMQWYQKFEYAIGHWLQKATEHMMGCVLCSPGCFSLFRAKAVMADNVMKTYTTVASQPKHFVQYDQGEDRWLCTLLLKQGWRVEYSAASDSFTACPETFKEFYNQRRRWMPSTILNIMDLLGDYKTVVKSNDDISYGYIFYQAVMMISTLIGPGSIFLMLIGAFNIAFNLSNTNSLLINLFLVLIFVLACCFLKSDHQIMIAQLLTLLYAIIMIAVYVGIILQIYEDGPLSLSALSVFFTFGTFLLAAILHPQEFWCLPCLVIYLATIPSMYLLLMIYSIFNLNDVSWGTREVPKKASEIEAEQEAKVEQAQKAAHKRGDGLLGYFQHMAESKKKGNLEFSLGNLMSCLCCTAEDPNDTKKELMMMADKLDKIERALHIQPQRNLNGLNNTAKEDDKKLMRHPTVILEADNESKPPKPSVPEAKKVNAAVKFEEPKKHRDEMKNPYWMEDNEENRKKCQLLVDAKRKNIPPKEISFWNDMIKQYLLPLDENKEEKKKISAGLKELKNGTSLSFMLVNVMWVSLVYMLQAKKSVLGWRWPLGAKGPNITFDATDLERSNQMVLEYEYLQLEPVGVFFVCAFIVIMLIQLVGMILHRLMTLGHIVASTNIGFLRHKRFNSEEYLNNHGVAVIKEIQDTLEMDKDGITLEEAVEQTIKNITTEDDETMRRLSKTSNINNNLRRADTISALKKKQSTYGQRKETIRRRTVRNKGISNESVPATIIEDDENDSKISPASSFNVRRTESKMDPEGMEFRDV